MTWVKPSAAWMGYRSGWGHKDHNQRRILAIDLHRDAFDALLHRARLASAQDPGGSDVVVQWDPERALGGRAGKHAWTEPVPEQRSLQMGLKGNATREYGHGDWIARIVDVTVLFNQVGDRLAVGDIQGATELLPVEEVYPMPEGLAIMAAQQYKKAGHSGCNPGANTTLGPSGGEARRSKKKGTDKDGGE